MPIADLGLVGSGSNKVDTTTLDISQSISVPAGTLLVAGFAFDNETGGTTPDVVSISTPADETAIWEEIVQHNSVATGESGGVVGALWAIYTTVPWGEVILGSIAVTISSPVFAKAGNVYAWSGASITQRSTPVGVARNASGALIVDTAGTAPVAGDLVVAVQNQEAAIASGVTGDTDTYNGSWSPDIRTGSSGGSALTNVVTLMQHKIVTADGHQSHQTGQTGGDRGGMIVSFQPASSTPPPDPPAVTSFAAFGIPL